MELQKLELFPDSKLNKNIFILVKSAQGSAHCIEACYSVYRILGKVNEIKKCTHNAG